MGGKSCIWLSVMLVILVGDANCITLFDATIYLTNKSNKTTLTAGCQSNGGDVGNFTILPHLMTVSFASHVIVKKRSFASCSMRLGNLHGNFLVFDWDRDKNRCADKKCSWLVAESGLSLYINNSYQPQFNWQ